MCCGVLILLRTNARLNPCLQSVKTYIENRVAKASPQKNLARCGSHWPCYSGLLLLKTAWTTQWLQGQVGVCGKKLRSIHTDRNRKQKKNQTSKKLNSFLPGARSCSLGVGLHPFSDLCHHAYLVYTQRHTCTCK